MNTNKQQEYYYGSLFEDDYLYRSLGSIVNQPDIALTELVANAWDAGATEVKIFIPEKTSDILTIEDNGTGLTPDEFQQRWIYLLNITALKSTMYFERRLT